MYLLIFKALHLIFMVSWFAGLFYLPRLFVYHAMTKDETSNARFKIMERKLFFGIMTPSATLTVLFGLGMLMLAPLTYLPQMWIHIKLALVALLILYHIYLGKLLYQFKHDNNRHSHIFYRIINEVPLLFLVAITFLAVLKPV